MKARLVWRGPALVLLGLALAAAAYGLARASANRVALRAVLGPLAWLEIAGLAISCALALAALVRELAAVKSARPREQPLAPLAAAFVVAVVAWGLFLGFVQPFQRLWFDLALAGAAGGFCLAMLVERTLPRRLGRLVVVLCASALLLELSLRGIAAVHPSPLLARVGDAPRRLLERFRCTPGELRFGFPCNRGGYYDVEFFRKRTGERLVASIGDSFHLGAVPHERHFTTVCEKSLGFPVASFGVAGIGPPEYLRLIVDEVLPLDPDAVVIGLFVGNDLSYADVEKDLPDRGLRGWLERDRVLVCVLPQRLARIAEEKRGREGPVAAVQGERARPVRGEELDAAFPWLSDPSREAATLSEAAFLRLETQRALEICRGDPPSLDSVFETLSAAQRACASTPLAVMLIPDEFQVEDALWADVLAHAGPENARSLDRDFSQRVLAQWLAKNGIPCLDLLPVLRAVPPEADGKRHVYHLRDTHFNARGNRVVGETLAKFLRALPRR